MWDSVPRKPSHQTLVAIATCRGTEAIAAVARFISLSEIHEKTKLFLSYLFERKSPAKL